MATKKIGASIVALVSTIYAVFRILNVINDMGAYNIFAAACEITLLVLVSIEAALLASSVAKPMRAQDASALLESAKQVLFSSNVSSTSANGDASLKTATSKITTARDYSNAPFDVVVFAENATLTQLRRCMLSLDLLEETAQVYIIDSTMSSEREALARQFSFHIAEHFHNIVATTSQVLICRGTDILYPDANKVVRTYESNPDTFLELRSVYSDERALGINGAVDISDKRQMIRESLSTRGLSTWSTGPAMVQAKAMENSSHATSAAQFFGACERNGIHGRITEEIVSEEISQEQTISEVQWRALDFKYSASTWKNKYNKKGSKLIGLGIKTWSAMINVSLVRRIATIALVLAYVLSPTSFEFVTREYLISGALCIAAILGGGYIAGDRRGIFSRIREFYFDIEAVMYTMYHSFLKTQNLANGKSIVKKLPSVSALLILTDAILVTRVYLQHSQSDVNAIPYFTKYVSLFAGYSLIVSLLVGLGMVIVRQSRSSMRREISRGANLNSEPVSLVDLSPGGAGCISVSEMEIGTEVEFESSLPTKLENVKFHCKARVRSCVEWNGSYRVGVEFFDLDQQQCDILETYCSIVYPHAQARDIVDSESSSVLRSNKINGKAEKRFLSYAASFIALGAIIFSNLSY